MYDKNKLLIDMKLGGGEGKAYMKLKRDEKGNLVYLLRGRGLSYIKLSGVGGSTN